MEGEPESVELSDNRDGSCAGGGNGLLPDHPGRSGGKDTEGRYYRGERIAPLKKALSGSERWFETDKGWISADYLQGWIWEDGRWWYLQPGYTYPTGRLEIINGKCYCFDFNVGCLPGTESGRMEK